MTDEDADPVFERGDVVDGDDPFTDGDAARRPFVETTPVGKHRDRSRTPDRPTDLVIISPETRPQAEMAGTDAETTTAEGVPQIVETEGVLGGDPRIEGTRIGVSYVSRRYVDGGDTPKEIAAGYDSSVVAVHAAFAYAFSHPRQMRDREARDRLAYEEADRLTPEDV